MKNRYTFITEFTFNKLHILVMLILLVQNAEGQIFNQIQSNANVIGEANGLYGNGVSFYDWNKDGLDDIVLTNDSIAPLFYQNLGGTFEPVQFPGVVVNNQVKSVCWVDINNDYFPDLAFNISYGTFTLFVNNGDFSFTDISSTCGIEQIESQGYGQSWGDFNNDGFIDVFISNYQNPSENYQNPNEFPERSNYLYKNNGDNTFTNVTEAAGISTAIETTFLSVWFDVNLDGFTDLYVLNDRYNYPNYLYLNNGDETFTDISESSGLREFFEPMSGTVGDYNHDGLLDVYVTDGLSNRLYKNNGDLTFTNVAGELGVQMNKACWGAAFTDVNNDGWEDLIVATANPFFTYNDLWYFRNYQGTFEVNQSIGFSSSFGMAYSIATGDIDDNGSTELLCYNLRPEGVKIFNNNTQGNYYKLSLEGTVSNYDGIGTLVKVYTGNNVQTKYMMCGDQYLSQNSQWLHFGLGDNTRIDSIVLKWPSGIIDKYIDVEVNQRINYREGGGILASISIENKSNFCIGDTAILDAGEWDSYIWPDGSTNRYYPVTESGEYTVTLSQGDLTFSSQPIQIQFSEPETAIFEIENTPCFNSSLGMIASANNAAGAVETIILNDIETALPTEYLSAGIYQYNFYGSNGCIIEGNIEITEPSEILVDLNFNIAGTSEECEGKISGYSVASGGVPPYSIEWRFYLENEIIPFQIISEENFDCIEFSETTNIQFRLSDANGCPIIIEETLVPSTDNTVSSETKFSINSNPFNYSFEVMASESANLSLFELSGKCIYSQKILAGSNNIYPNNIASGIYILNLRNNNLNFNTRIVKL